jgi:hypothetical protein
MATKSLSASSTLGNSLGKTKLVEVVVEQVFFFSVLLLLIQDADFYNPALRMKIRYIFDRIADCAGMRRYESTDTSTILHTILPKLFIIWDNNIKKSVKVQSRGANYSGVFLLKMQRELNEAIKTCMCENRIERSAAISYIETQSGNKTMAKLADEYNYMKYVKRHSDII